MSMGMIFYADESSTEVLAGSRPKALLIGSDFGYGNFGDVLQHMGAVARLRSVSSLLVASVLSVDAISRGADFDALRQAYGVDALMFVSSAPLQSDQAAALGLRQVVTVSNIAWIQLYGGGFLNEMWGDFVLGVAEYFLRRLPNVEYVISGQQVSPGYVPRVAAHVAEFKPQLLGVRDRDSLASLTDAGLDAEFSFDDAVEPLLAFGDRFKVATGNAGAFIHLNSSGYTGNGGELDEIKEHLGLVARNIGRAASPVLFQAFQDAREEVIDSIETIKRLDTGFPFANVETVLLVAPLLDPAVRSAGRMLEGRFGYSCSYHVTLWLQLCGVPCWLRGSNSYYDQKRRSLGIEGDFGAFLERMPKPGHSENLAARAKWAERLDSLLGDVKPAENSIAWEPDGSESPRAFNFKGEPRLEMRLSEVWASAQRLREENGQLITAMDKLQEEKSTMDGLLREEIAECDLVAVQLTASNADRDAALKQIQILSIEQAAANARLDELGDGNALLLGRLLESTEQVAGLKAELRQVEQAASEQERRLVEARADAGRVEKELRAIEKHEAQLMERARALTSQLTALGAENRALEGKLRDAEAGWYAACRGNEQLSETVASVAAENERLTQELNARDSRLLAYNAKIVEIGSDARRYREQAEWSHSAMLDVADRERRATELLQAIKSSRSWRWTRPLRALNRFAHTGRFDANGNIGLFGVLQLAGRRTPLPAAWKSALGRWLQKLRRR